MRLPTSKRLARGLGAPAVLVAVIAGLGLLAGLGPAPARAGGAAGPAGWLRVCGAVTVTAPAAASGAASGTSDSPTVVGTDTWVVTSDETAGATLVVSAPRFAHVTEPGAAADVRLRMWKVSGSAWTVLTGDATSSAQAAAEVRASSSGPGNGSFDVEVSFLPGDVSVLPGGDYTTTLTGTIAPNP